HFLSGQGSPRILDIGCGTGNASAELLKLIPGARITCLDGSKEMLSAARGKLTSTVEDFHWLDLTDHGWEKTWAGDTFDAAFSVFVLEHLPFDAYQAFLRSVWGILKPGAPLVTAEGYGGQLNQTLFFDEMAQCEEQALRRESINPRELAETKEMSTEKERHYFTEMDEKKRWWRDAGLVDVNFIWQYYCLAILAGQKPR
ncbi:MAG: class I SAM-dependent methyltransferase, partial [Deltaproteobacteria bacterium]